MLTTDVENYPGFPDGIMGPELMMKFREQAERFGAEFVTADADRGRPLARRRTASGSATASSAPTSMIISTGAKARMLGLPNEQRLLGHGVSTCATCDGFFFREPRRSRSSAAATPRVEEAIFLTKFATKVTLIHRRDELRASKIMQDRAFANPKIEFLWNSEVERRARRRHGRGAAPARHRDRRRVRARGERPLRRHRPRPEHRRCSPASSTSTRTATSSPTPTPPARRSTGVFAAGDVQDHVYRQAITAAGRGCMAAIEAERWLGEHAARRLTPTALPGMTATPGTLCRRRSVDRPTSGKDHPVADDILTLSDATFDETIGGADTPVLVDFWAEWCGPCKMIAPTLDEIASEQKGKLADRQAQRRRQPRHRPRFDVMSIPTLLVFKDGSR